MNSETRKELLRALMELCQRYPHWRFGQLVANVTGWADGEVWDIDDDALLSAAKSHLDHLGTREEIGAER